MTALPTAMPVVYQVPLNDLVDAVALRTGAWVAVERFGQVLAHGRGSMPCPAALASAIVGKSTLPLRQGAVWSRGRRPLRGTLDGASIVVADLCPGGAAWFIGGAMEPGSLPALAAALNPDAAPLTDVAIETLLHPRGPARRASAPPALLVAVLASAYIAELARCAAAAAVAVDGRVHVEGDVVLVALHHEADPCQLVDQVRATYPSAVAGVAPVPTDASDWAATFRLARGLARAANTVGVAIGRIDDPAVLADLVLREAQSAAADLLIDLPQAPLNRLSEYDQRTSGQLVASVEAWCDNGLDVAAAASALSLHHNTLRYRLKRASEISGLDMAHPRQMLALQLLLTN